MGGKSGVTDAPVATLGRGRWFLLWAVLAAVTLAVYANSIGNGFVWDDHDIIVANPANRDLSAIGTLFTSADVVVATEPTPYYRPLNRLTYLLDYRLFGTNPAGYHAEGIMIHLAVVTALFCLAGTFFGEPAPAFAAALLLAVHPVNAEAVNFISARNNLLATLFVLLSLLAFLRGERTGRRGYRYAAAFLFFCGILCKETALMLLPLLLVAPSPLPRRRLADKMRALVPFFLAACVYLVLRANALSGAVGESLAFGGIGRRLAEDLYIVPRYVVNLLLPLRLSTGYAVPAGFTAADWWLGPVWIGLVWGAVRIAKSGPPVARFGLIWCAINFLPVANIVPIPSAAMADRYLYLPAVGFWLAATDLARGAFARHRVLILACGVAVIASLSAITAMRNADWRDDVALFSRAVRVEPDFPKGHYNLGVALLEKGEMAAAERELRRAVEIDPSYAEALGQLGYIMAQQKDYREAERYFAAAVRAKPENAEAQFNLALLLEKTGRPREALPHYEQFLKRVPPRLEPLVPRVKARVEELRRQ